VCACGLDDWVGRRAAGRGRGPPNAHPHLADPAPHRMDLSPWRPLDSLKQLAGEQLYHKIKMLSMCARPPARTLDYHSG
jgi:hypothetical protein